MRCPLDSFLTAGCSDAKKKGTKSTDGTDLVFALKRSPDMPWHIVGSSMAAYAYDACTVVHVSDQAGLLGPELRKRNILVLCAFAEDSCCCLKCHAPA